MIFYLEDSFIKKTFPGFNILLETHYIGRIHIQEEKSIEKNNDNQGCFSSKITIDTFK